MIRLTAMARRALIAILFHSWESEGAERLPARGALLVIANGLRPSTDWLIIQASSPRPLASCPERGALDRVPGILARHGAACVLSDTLLTQQPSERLRQLIVQAARSGVAIVPAGLCYDDRGTRRPAVWVRVGRPVQSALQPGVGRRDGPNDVVVTVRAELQALTLRFEHPEESPLLNWAAEVLATEGIPPQPLDERGPSLARRLDLLQRVQQHYRTLRREQWATVSDLVGRVQRYRQRLYELGISPAEVYLTMTPGRAAFFVVRELELLLVGLPLAVWGAANHIVPWLISRWRDPPSTAMAHVPDAAMRLRIYALCYAAQLAAAWALLPPWAAALYTVTVPYSGLVTVLYRDRLGGMWQRSRTFIRFLLRRSLQTELMADGRALVADMRRLADDAARRVPPSATGAAR